jgi:uncharacterized membrane protein
MMFLRRWKYTITTSCVFIICAALLIAQHKWAEACTAACIVILMVARLYRERDQ